MIANKTESQLLIKQVSCGCRCRLDGKGLKMIKQNNCWWKRKKAIKRNVGEM